MDRELSLEELETEHATELPERDTLTTFNIASVNAWQTAVAFNILSKNASATAFNVQSVWINQQNER